jgi:hypothetical protein
MSSQQFRLNLIRKRLSKLNFNQREARIESRMALIPDGDYLFTMEWNGKTVMQPVVVFRNLSSPLILGIDAIANFGIVKNKKLCVSRVT